MTPFASSAAQADTGWVARLGAAVPAILYGIRLASAVSLALFIAFSLELDNPSWAGTSAAIVCQPILGASLRKGMFRMIGTVVGATMTVVLTGLFPQNRVGFLVGMALWAAACSFGNTLTRNFAAYGFALAGYTMAIIAGDSIAEPGQAFHLALTRATEIILGIACAMAVTGLTDLGQSRRKLAEAMDGLGHEILARFSGLMEDPRHSLDGAEIRRGLIARVAALDPAIDQAIGEEPELRHRVRVLRDAVSGLFAALSGWRIAESHLVHLPEAVARARTRPVADRLPPSWRELGPAATGEQASEAVEPDVRHDGAGGRHDDLSAARALAALKAGSGVSQRLLADAAAKWRSGSGRRRTVSPCCATRRRRATRLARPRPPWPITCPPLSMPSAPSWPSRPASPSGSSPNGRAASARSPSSPSRCC